MAYCQGDVYMYSDGHEFHCMGCALTSPEAQWGDTVNVTVTHPELMLGHMRAHAAAGHDVEGAIERLEREVHGKGR